MSYRFLRDDDSAAPAMWRPLDRALAQWVRAHGGSALLAEVAAWASHADGLGDAALPLRGDDAGRHGMAPLDAAAIAALQTESLVGDGSQLTPFVLDGDGHFALWRNHAHELAIAAHVRQRRVAMSVSADLRADLDVLFAGRDDAAVRRQREAVAGAIARKLFVLTGGPGTGKTTTVLRMMLMRLRHAPAALPVIQVAAPTGKAAQRLTQALREGRRALDLPAEWQALFEAIPDTDALTVHRLLGFDARRNTFTRDRRRPIAADIVVIDEASMLDLAMLRALFDALRPEASVIFVGDADQLTSVATGSVLMDLVAALENDNAPELVRLDHSFRAERGLGAINDAVRVGDAARFADAFDAAGEQARYRGVNTPATLRRAIASWAQGLSEQPLRPMLPLDIGEIERETGDAVQGELFASPPSPPDLNATRSRIARDALRALAQRQLLCALREERYGAVAVNALIEAELKRLWQVPPDAAWYAGRAVIVARNEYSQRLFNGDIGLCLADSDGTLRVWFELPTPEGESAARAIAPSSLPPHESAFAITVHKSQGSEYRHAAVLLPADPEHRILSRQLLYTAVSRARSGLELWASTEVIAAALARPIRRVGGLMKLLSRHASD